MPDIWRSGIASYATTASLGRKRWLPYLWLLDLARRILPALLEGNARITINAPPRHGKSEMISHWLPTWFIERWPRKQIILASYGGDFAGEWGKKVRDEFTMNSLCLAKLRSDSRATESWMTTEDGGMKTAGVGGPITGRGADLVIIDDPHKNWEEAMSPIHRERVIEWFNSTLYTRLEPHASIIVIQCMTGDTQVLMGDGREKSLSDVRPGEEVVTYNAGRVETARVNNWINNGLDLVFTIKMISGISVKANARHPFLADRDGRLEWVRLRNLRPGDRLVGLDGERGRGSAAKSKDVTTPLTAKDCAKNTLPNSAMKKTKTSACDCTLLVGGGSGKASSVRRKAVINRCIVKGSVLPITTNGAGQRESGLQAATQKLIEETTSNIDMESPSSSMKQCLKNREDYVPFAENLLRKIIPAPIGKGNSVLITSMGPSKFEDCCVTIATSPSDTARPNEFYSPQLATYEIILDTIVEIVESGREEVFDIEVDRTGNFIANGLVSHNTRWHERDLSGYLINEHSDPWQLIRYPAIAEDDNDILGRAEGDALCPPRFPIERLNEIKHVVGSHIFAGLYQQRPAPIMGGIVKKEWLRYWTELPTNPDEWIQSWDLTFKATGTSYAVGQVWCRSKANYYLVDQIRGKMDFIEQLKQIAVLTRRWPGALTKVIEDAADAQAVKSTLDETVPGIVLVRARGSKEARLAGIVGAIESGNVYLPANVTWLDEFVSEITTFPGTVNDDQVDALTLALDRLIQKSYDTDIRLPDLGRRANPWENAGAEIN